MRSFGRKFQGFVSSIGAYDGEDPEQRTKRIVFVVAVLVATTLTIPSVFDLRNQGLNELAFSLLGIVVAGPACLVLLAARPLWFPWVVNGMFAVVVGEGFYSAALVGGLLETGLGAANNLIIPLAALMIFGRRPALFWFGMYALSVIYAATISNFVEPVYPVEPSQSDAAETLVLMAIVIMAITLYFVRQRDRFQQQSDDLLHNTLPAVIVSELKQTGGVAAQRFDSASVLFADIVGFTHLSEELGPEEMVDRLNEVFTFFDSLTAKHRCEKIRTIGDNYMVACGVPLPRDDHATVLTAMGLEMLTYAETSPFAFRIGINSGPLVAGVVGTSKFQYDVWGDTVNTASRMESHGEPGRLQIGEATHELIGPYFMCTPRGPIEVKGKGTLETWWVEGRRGAI